MPSRQPTRGCIFSKTPACEAVTLATPQFHSSFGATVQSGPLTAMANHAVREMPPSGGIPYRSGTQIGA